MFSLATTYFTSGSHVTNHKCDWFKVGFLFQILGFLSNRDAKENLHTVRFNAC